MAEMIQTNGGNDDRTILRAEALKKYFPQSDGFLDKLFGGSAMVKAVDGVDFTIDRGETLGVVGESGCGKSTLAQTVIKLHQPTAGSIYFDGEDISALSNRKMRPYRRRVQMIFQDPLASLNPRKTIGETLVAPMKVHDIGNSKEERRERAQALLERVGLKAGHIDRYPHQFSGGQQQRVGIARALTVEPDLLIADEPVSALDVSVQAQVLKLLRELQAEFDLGMLFIGHDLSVVRYISDRVAVMYLGEFVETGPADRVFEEPQHPYTQSLISSIPRIDPAERPDKVTLEGTVPSPIDPPTGCRFHTRCPAIIPPDEWTGSQSDFRQVFTFKQRVERGDVDTDAIETRLRAEGSDATETNVKEYILEELVGCDVTDLPEWARETLATVASELANDNEERAKSLTSETFTSVCKKERPAETSLDEDHTANCHLLDEGHTPIHSEQ